MTVSDCKTHLYWFEDLVTEFKDMSNRVRLIYGEKINIEFIGPLKDWEDAVIKIAEDFKNIDGEITHNRLVEGRSISPLIARQS